MNCIFCAIAAGEAPATIVAESDAALAFMDIQPGADGHTLVIPRIHSADLSEIDDSDLAAVASLARRVAQAQIEVLGAEGVNLVQSNGAAAFQSVFHLHFHVIPRRAGDGIVLPWRPAPADGARLEATADLLREALT